MRNVLVDESGFVYHTVYSVWNARNNSYPCNELALQMCVRDRICQMLSYIGGDGIVVFAYDSKKLWRKEVYPAYKGDRPEKTEEFRRLLGVCREVYSEFRNITHVTVEGLEADDVIYSYVVDFMDAYADNVEVTIFSKDSDLRQLLTVNPKLKYEWFDSFSADINTPLPKKLMGVSIDNLQKFTALAGGHNNLVKILGPTESARVLKNDTLNTILKADAEMRRQYEFNMQMVRFIHYTETFESFYDQVSPYL